ncbi:MAG: Hpt domain-containing protein [Pseudomonadota bacterium]
MPESNTGNSIEPIFNVDGLFKYMGSDEKGRAIIGKIVHDALVGGREPVQQACAAVRSGQYGEAARVLHGLRGTVGNLGAKRFVSAALALELAMAEQRQHDVPILLPAIEREFDLVMQSGNSWLKLYGLPPV